MDELERLLLKLKERWVDGKISEEQYWKMKIEILAQPNISVHSKVSEKGLEIESDKTVRLENDDEVRKRSQIAIEEEKLTLFEERSDYSKSGDAENAEERLGKMISPASIASLASREPAVLSNVDIEFAEPLDLLSTVESNKALGVSSLRAKEDERWRDSKSPPGAASPERRHKSGQRIAIKGVASMRAKELHAILSISLESIRFAGDYLRYSLKIALAMGIALAFSLLVLPLVAQ